MQTGDPSKVDRPVSGGQEIAWKVHTALIEHTGRADNKAGLVLSLEVAVLGAVVALTSPSRALDAVSVALAFYLGVGLVLGAVVVAVTAIAPRIHPQRSKLRWRSNFIYFGHLRFWDPDQLARAMREQDPIHVLSRQLVDISEIVWIKHRRVQISLWLAVAGGLALLVAGLWQ